MTLRFSERYVIALNLLLIAILAYFLALSVNDIILGRVARGTTRTPAARWSAPRPSHRSPGRVPTTTRSRSATSSTLPPVVEAPAEVATNLHIKLLGTSTLTLSQPFIIVEDDNNHEQSLYRMGDDIPDAGELVGVYKDHAIILHQGHRTKLEMPADQNGRPATPTHAPRPFGLPGRGIRGNLCAGRSGRTEYDRSIPIATCSTARP